MDVLRTLLTALVLGILLTSSGYSQALDFTVDMGDPNVVADYSGVPLYPWFPDSRIVWLPDGDQVQMYWPGGSTYRTVGTTIEDMTLEPVSTVIGPGAPQDFDNGGSYLMSVHRLDGDNLVAFCHAEDFFPEQPNPEYRAWKSIGVATSSDNGITWTKHGQIITSRTPRPSVPTNGGAGDFCVVRDEINSRWVCVYCDNGGADGIRIAISTDITGQPGSWYKWHSNSFSEPGLGGESDPPPGLEATRDGNVTVFFSTYLDKWVMITPNYDRPDNPGQLRGFGFWISASDDLINWEEPSILLGDDNIWYPGVVGVSDVLVGREATLYYANWPLGLYQGPRQFIARQLTFLLDTDHDGLDDAVETGTGVFIDANDTGTDPTIPDTDGDGLIDGDEVNDLGTDPCSRDTDLDGVGDGEEVAWGYDPLNPLDTPELPVSSRLGTLLIVFLLLLVAARLLRREESSCSVSYGFRWRV